MGTMKAARIHGQRDIRVERIAEPECGKGMVKVLQTAETPSNNILRAFQSPISRGPTDPLFSSQLQIKPAFVGICGSGSTHRICHRM